MAHPKLTNPRGCNRLSSPTNHHPLNNPRAPYVQGTGTPFTFAHPDHSNSPIVHESANHRRRICNAIKLEIAARTNISRVPAPLVIVTFSLRVRAALPLALKTSSSVRSAPRYYAYCANSTYEHPFPFHRRG